MTPVLKIFGEEIFHRLTQLRFPTKNCLLRLSQRICAIKRAFETFSLNQAIALLAIINFFDIQHVFENDNHVWSMDTIKSVQRNYSV